MLFRPRPWSEPGRRLALPRQPVASSSELPGHPAQGSRRLSRDARRGLPRRSASDGHRGLTVRGGDGSRRARSRAAPATLLPPRSGARAGRAPSRASEQRISPARAHGAVAARIAAPDDEVARAGRQPAGHARGAASSVPVVALAAVVEPVRVGRAREEVAERHESGAVGRRAAGCGASGIGRSLAVVDPGLVADAPARLRRSRHGGSSAGGPSLLHSMQRMALRVALVTPFAWSQPHDVNEHVAGLAGELRARGHGVTVLAPSNRRPRPRRGAPRTRDAAPTPSSIALGPAVPIARRSRMGVPVGVRANLAVALGRGALRHRARLRARPAEPFLSRAPRRDRADRRDVLLAGAAAYPPGRAQRERLLGRLDALLATSAETAEAAAERFPGRYELVPLGVDLELFAPAEKRNVVVLEWRQTERPLLPRARARARRAARLGARAPPHAPARRRGPPLPRALRGRVRVRTALDASGRAAVLRDAAVFVPAFEGDPARRARGAGRRRRRRVAARAAPTSPSSPPPRRRG